MSIFDALAIAGAGVGRGVRQGQAIRREIAEARRKALLEERQQRVQEKEADTIAEFRRAQIRDMEDQLLSRSLEREKGKQDIEKGGLDIQRTRGELSEADRLRRYRQTRILPEGKDLDLPFLPGSPDVPGTMEGLLDVQDLFREYLQGQASMYGAVYGRGGREPSDFEQALKLTLDQIGAPSGYETLPGQIEDALARRPEFIMETFPKMLELIRRQRRGVTAADTTGDAAMRKRYDAFMKQLGGE